VAAEKAAAEAVSALEAELANTKHTLSTETDRFNLHAEAAKNKFTELHHSFEAARSAETQARGEADRATGESAQYKERLESARAQFSVRLKEYLLQVAELERGAQVLAADPASAHVLRPSQLQAAAQSLATDLHAASADQVRARCSVVACVMPPVVLCVMLGGLMCDARWSYV